jgi:hypothetical protein
MTAIFNMTMPGEINFNLVLYGFPVKTGSSSALLAHNLSTLGRDHERKRQR